MLHDEGQLLGKDRPVASPLLIAERADSRARAAA